MSGGSKPKSWYSSYVLFICGLVSILNYYDRQLITILVEPVKRDLHITDGQVGLLAGIGFALMYSILGVPMARLADRFGRARILAGVLTLWSAMTAISGATVNFTTMLLARAGVGVGEAGGLPATHALIADHFSPERRGFALALIGVCAAIGSTAALILGGMISDLYGWRWAFFLAGAPGIVLALIVFLTVRDAPKPATASGVRPAEVVSIGAAFKTLWGRKSFVLLCVAVAIGAIGSYGQSAWIPSFLMREYDLTAAEVGVYSSAALGPPMIIAILVGGALNDWLVRRDKRAPLWILALCFGLTAPGSWAFFLIGNLPLALGFAAASAFIGGLWVGPAYALVQSLAGPQLRALTAAVFMMIVNVVGLGLGPFVAGALSDALAPQFAEDSLKFSLCIVTVACAIAVIPFLWATRMVRADIIEADS